MFFMLSASFAAPPRSPTLSAVTTSFGNAWGYFSKACDRLDLASYTCPKTPRRTSFVLFSKAAHSLAWSKISRTGIPDLS